MPRLPGGGPHFSREMGRKRAGATPLDPGVHGRSFPLAGFWVGCLWCVRGAISSGMLKPIWDAFSRENMLESIFAKESLQSLPLGGRTVRGTVRSGPGEATINHRCPSAHTGADEGAILYPTFPCRKKALSRLSPQRGFSIASLGNPVAPSSVTFGDSFPPRGSLWAVQPHTKKRPKSGRVHGPRNSPSTGTMRHDRQNERASSERALKKGGRGPSPATLCVRAFS